jgi:transaldolase
MKFFIDTANLEQIKEAQALGVLDGVTTNPSLMAKEGITGADNILRHYVDICNIVDGDVSAEVIATDFAGMIKEGEALAALHPQIVVKLPMIADGVKACKYFSDKGIRTNVHWVRIPTRSSARLRSNPPLAAATRSPPKDCFTGNPATSD